MGYDAAGFHRGIKGEVDLVSAQPINNTTAIVHPMQVVYSSVSFLGWGTAKGIGVDNCPDYFGTKWQVYFDGRDLGDYFCKQPYGEIADAGQDQFFRIEYTACPGDGQNKYVVYWNSAWKSCKTIGTTSGEPNAGSESIGTQLDQNLRVHYSAMRVKPVTGDWRYISTLSQCEPFPPYHVDAVGTSTWSIDQ